jgi:membrane protein DedA with SNARE-associated domain
MTTLSALADLPVLSGPPGFSDLSDALGGDVPAGAAYAMVTVAVLAESVLLIGAFIPTLTLLLTAGALARTASLSLPLVIAAAACAVVAGDFLAHRTGGLLGARLRTGRLGCRIPTAAWQRAEALMARFGGQAVFLSRFLPVIRTLTPHLAGATRLPYRRIAPYSAVAASVWATAEIGIGYAAATSVQSALALGPVLAAIAVTAAGAALVWAKIRRRHGPGLHPCRCADGARPVRFQPGTSAGRCRNGTSRCATVRAERACPASRTASGPRSE